MEKELPLETAARACVAKLASQIEEQIQKLLCHKKIALTRKRRKKEIPLLTKGATPIVKFAYFKLCFG